MVITAFVENSYNSMRIMEIVIAQQNKDIVVNGFKIQQHDIATLYAALKMARDAVEEIQLTIKYRKYR